MTTPRRRASTPPPATTPSPPVDPKGELKRFLSIAIFKAKRDCCETCNNLADVRDDMIAAIPMPVYPIPTLDADGKRGFLV
jgi:hypothetical protein